MLSDILMGGNLLQLKVKFRPYFRDRYLQIDFDFAEKDIQSLIRILI